MYNAANGTEISGERSDGFSAIAANLFSLVEQVQAGIDLIETAIARGVSTGEAEICNIIVLDDVTLSQGPRCAERVQCEPWHRPACPARQQVSPARGSRLTCAALQKI